MIKMYPDYVWLFSLSRPSEGEPHLLTNKQQFLLDCFVANVCDHNDNQSM